MLHCLMTDPSLFFRETVRLDPVSTRYHAVNLPLDLGGTETVWAIRPSILSVPILAEYLPEWAVSWYVPIVLLVRTIELVAVQPVKSPVSKSPFFTSSSEACETGSVLNVRTRSNGKMRSFCVAETDVSYTHHSSVLEGLKKISRLTEAVHPSFLPAVRDIQLRRAA